MSASRQCRALRLPVAALTLLLIGCSAPAVAPSPAPQATRVMASESSRLSQVRTTVDALVHAARTRDRKGFERLISDRDPAFPDRARLLYDNLSTLPLTRLQMRVEPARFDLSQARTQLLGSTAWAQRAVVSWRLVGDDTDVEHQIWLTFLSDGGQVKLAGTVDEPPNRTGEQKPSWWLGPVHRHGTRRGHCRRGFRPGTGSLGEAGCSRPRQRARQSPRRSAAFVERSGSAGSAGHAARL